MTAQGHAMMADLLLAVHMLLAAFNVLGLPAVWIGALAGRRWARNRWFRLAHLASMGAVAGLALLGRWCPLTVWENRLRVMAGQGERYQGSFLRHFAEQWFYTEAPVESFVAAYVAFFVLVALTLVLVPVNWRGR